MARALVNVPKTVRRDQVFEVKALISHPMETGYRPGPDGKILARDIISRFTCEYDGSVVFVAELHPALAANPYLVFTIKATRSGEVVLTWTGDNGFQQTETASIEVT